MNAKKVSRPALNVVTEGGQIVITDPVDEAPRQIIGPQADGTVAVVEVNGDPVPAPSTPVVGAIGAGLAVTWDGLLAGDTTGPQLLANGDFEAGIDPWMPGGATIAQSSVQVQGGGFSCLITPVGAENGMPAAGLSSEQVPVTAGQSYLLDAWVWLTTAVTLGFDLAVDWYSVDPATGLQALISTSSDPASVVAGAWVQIVRSVTAPSAAVFAVVRPTLTGASATDLWYLDGITFAQVVSDVPANFDHLAVHVSQLDGFNPDGSTLAGTLNHSGTFPVTDLTAGTTYFVKLVAVNTSGIAGGVSTQVSGQAGKVVANEADFTARDIGGITTTIAATPPPNALAGDLWFDQANGYRLNQYNGTAWAPYQWATGSIKSASITADQIAAATILAGNIAARQITGDLMAVNTIQSVNLAAASITADKLAATLVLASQIIAGTVGGSRVQLDVDGINAYDNQGNAMVTIGSNGSAQFSGDQVSANLLSASSVEVASQDGGYFIYSLSGTILNANPYFTTDLSSWSAGSGGQISRVTNFYNGAPAMHLVPNPVTSVGYFAASEWVPVTGGLRYSAETIIQFENPLSGAPSSFYLEITWADSTGKVIGRTGSPTVNCDEDADPQPWITVSCTGKAPAAAATARIRLSESIGTSGGNDGIYFGYAYLSSLNQRTSLANHDGTDDFGSYRAGLDTPFDVHARNLPGNFHMGHVATSTGSGGDITVNHGAGFTPDAVVCFPNTAVSGYVYSVHDITATQFTVRVQGGANAAGGGFVNVGSGQPVDFNFLAFKA